MDQPHHSSSEQSAELGVDTDYRAVFEALSDPVFLFDPDSGQIVNCNDASAELFGYPQERLGGLSLEAISSNTGPHTRSRMTDIFATVTTDHPVTIEREAMAKDGREFRIKLTLKAVWIDDRKLILGTITDIEDSHKRKQDNRTFKTAVENAGHSIYWTDADGTIQYVNPAFEAITGYDSEEVIGRNPRLLQSGEMDEEYYHELWETIRSGETFEREVINESADGERFVASQTIAPITGPDGEIERFVAVNSDITERKKREERLKAEKEQVEQLHQRLSVMNRILRHDIRSSVNIIKGNAEIADSSNEQDRALETIVEEAERLQRIAESVRHIEGAIDETETAPDVIDVGTMLQTKVLRYRNEYPAANFEMDIPDSVFAQARERFGLALDHLLANAIKHNDRTHPTVEVAITEHEQAETIQIVIADDGPGIPPAEVKPLEAGRETPLQHTSGLGLWLTQWIVDVSEGELSFEENEPRGTRIRIELEQAS